jgi:DNA primase
MKQSEIMKTTETPEGYGSLVAEAEKAVASVKDEKLREIAFSQVLSHLLSGGAAAGAGPIKPHRAAQSSKKATKADSNRSEKFKASGPKAWLRELVEEKFFTQPKASRQILEELGNRSHHLKSTDLTRPLEALCHEKILRRKKLAAEEGKSAVYHWSNW